MQELTIRFKHLTVIINTAIWNCVLIGPTGKSINCTVDELLLALQKRKAEG